MTNYQRGAAFELRVKADLERDGYVVVRSAGSHGAADLVGLKPGQVLLVQAKRDGKCPPAERESLLALAGMLRAEPLVALMPGVRGIAYRRLTGPGPRDFVAWSADSLGEETVVHSVESAS